MDLLIRTGLFDAMKERGWYAVVSSETVTFRKSLELWQRFDVESRFIGQDDKALFLEHRAVVDSEVYAKVIVRARMLRRTGGTVPHDEFFGVWDDRTTSPVSRTGSTTGRRHRPFRRPRRCAGVWAD